MRHHHLLLRLLRALAYALGLGHRGLARYAHTPQPRRIGESRTRHLERLTAPILHRALQSQPQGGTHV